MGPARENLSPLLAPGFHSGARGIITVCRGVGRRGFLAAAENPAHRVVGDANRLGDGPRREPVCGHLANLPDVDDGSRSADLPAASFRVREASFHTFAD